MVAKINRLIAFVLCFLTGTVCLIRQAVASDITLISDAETQNYLAAIVRPLFQAAGLSFNANKIFIVNDNSLNAFVSDGNYMFVNTGTILSVENTNELAGILAHETGHIMGGHIVRQKIKLENMQYVMLGSLIAAGATAVSTGRGDAAMAVMMGTQSSILNSILHYQVQEERSADESAVKLLSKTHQSTQGLKNFMRKIKKQYALSGVEENPYFRTHPLTAERISHFEESSKNNHYDVKSPLDSKLKLVQAKLAGFLWDENKVHRLYPNRDNSVTGQYARSILSFREGRIVEALSLVDSLIKTQSQNPYFYELKGQFLFESGKVNESIAAYEQSLKLLPNNHILQVSLAHALLESSSAKQNVHRIINLLQQSLISYKDAFSWQLLARAYDLNNDTASSLYAAAEYNYAIGNLDTAKMHLDNAAKKSKNKALNLKIADLKERVKADMKDRR